MSRSSDIRILEVSTGTERISFRAPIKFGGRVVTSAIVLNVNVTVETRGGQQGQGCGSMPIGNVWAWPSQSVSAEQSEAAMLEFGLRCAKQAGQYAEQGHPLDITHDLSAAHQQTAADVAEAAGLAEPPPRLAQMVAASPVEAALHDAFGRALGQNSYNLLGREYVHRDLSHYLNADFNGEYLDQYTLRDPKPRMPLYHLVGALDPLSDDEVAKPIEDGLPETLGDWIRFNGLTHLKFKLNGDDLDWDVQRVVAVEDVSAQAQFRRECPIWHYSLDFNE
ncbi:MAG: hypothetical protein AB7O62_17700, partial [Pirellulales bacterium]